MPLNVELPKAVPVGGVELVTLSAGIKNDGSPDLVVVRLADPSKGALVMTQSAFAAAPVQLCREHMQRNQGAVRALVINSGNANAGTGEPGLDMARDYTQWLAARLQISADQVLPFSTGVIGQLLPIGSIRDGLAEASQYLETPGPDRPIVGLAAFEAASRGIMTTDTQPKLSSQQIEVDGQTITLTGMAKGSGMIEPHMATLLSYVFTDADVTAPDLRQAISHAVADSFNAITVDSDTSTNDACFIAATGASGIQLSPTHPEWDLFVQALNALCLDLAKAIVLDAEGASKFIQIRVAGGQSTDECRMVAYAVANSPLVKTAMFASDANVGRLLMAIGKSGVSLDPAKVRVFLGNVVVFENAGIASSYTEQQGAELMAQEHIDVNIDLGRGNSCAVVFTSDLSHDYVSINADYRS